MNHAVLIAAWIGAVLWPLALALWLMSGKRGGRAARVVAGVVSGAWALGVWAFLIEPETLAVRRVTMESPAWRGPPLRIALLSDTHGGGPHVGPARLRSVVARINAESPDVVMLAGDYASGHVRAERRTAQERRAEMESLAAFAAFRAPLGTYAVLGNHDWWYDGDSIERGLREAGVIVLENAAARVPRPEGAFWIAGLSDYESERGDPDYPGAMAQVQNPVEPVIGLVHRPMHFMQAPPRVAVTLAGHTHCGQVNFPIVGRLASEARDPWTCGPFESEGRRVYTTGGLGVSVLPVRFRQPPEVVIMTLQQAPMVLDARLRPRLETAYREPQRAYHTLAHIEDCLKLLDQTEGLSFDDRRAAFYALWFHDAVYDPTRSDNEEKSAELAIAALAEIDEPEEMAEEVARLIRLTKGHTVAKGDALGALVVSIDLSILGADPARYDAYAREVRREFAHVPEAAFRQGRRTILKRFLAERRIFPDPAFSERFESQARANLAREIDALAGGD